MKQVNQSDLIIGELYCDSPNLHGWHAVIMRYLGMVRGAHEFKYIAGTSEYINEGDDIIRLPHYKKEPNWYWLVDKEDADFINGGAKS